MSNDSSFDSVLSDMVGYYDDQNRRQEVQANLAQAALAAALKAPKVEKVSKTKAKRLASNAEQPEGVQGTPAPSRQGEIDFQGFKLAMREAGYRSDVSGKRFLDPNEVRGDKIIAIDRYVGYNHAQDFGSQELMATSQANREAKGADLSQGPNRSEIRRAKAMLQGYTAGSPDTRERTIQDLKARERIALDTISQLNNELENMPMDPSLYPSEQKAKRESSKTFVLLKVEQERLTAILNDLASYM